MIDFACFQKNCGILESRIAAACQQYGRTRESVCLLPVTKTHPRMAVEYAARAGFTAVGENRVQEALDKINACQDLPMRWEIIGHLQSNKAKIAATHLHRIQSVDTEKLLRKLAHAAVEHERCLPILLQVNAGDDPAKFGVDCQGVDALLECALSHKSLEVQGLMTIAPLDDNTEVARRCFHRLRETRDRLEAAFAHPLRELSMGMSDDLEYAIEAGSTLIRVGSALFGARPPQ